GGGYPQGLKEEAIPLLARIIAVIDAYDAMTHDRPYRKRLSRQAALAELQRCAGRQFDPRLVSIFTEIMQTQTMACERGKKGDSADNTI
ncbi:MAG: phosphohydrolase, partial [Ruminococcaceae bacterium]|nr:phosphohydrolase [Oscillospiraceae bacterium]